MLKGNVNHSVAFWCFSELASKWPWTLEEMCVRAKDLGIQSVELVDPEHWPTLRKYGLKCAITLNGVPGLFVRGFNNPGYQEQVIAATKERIDACAANSDVCQQVIAFTGYDLEDVNDPQSNKISREDGAKNCIKGLKRVANYAEIKGVIISLEMLNTRDSSHPMKGHPGYQGDDLDYMADIVRGVGSPFVGLLFDVYHVQIMHGDVIRRIRQYGDIITHYHTAGNPGRGELDEKQEINYPAVMQAIVQTGYRGFVGHEFIPTRDPETGLKEAVTVCDV